MVRFLLCLAAACCCCCLALLLPPVQGRPVAGRDHRLLFQEPHFDVAEPTEQQGGEPVKKKATPSWSPPSPPTTAGAVATPELRFVRGGANPLHNHGSTTRQDGERTPPTAAAAEGIVGVVRPELRWVPGGANPLHNHGSTTRQDGERTPPAAAAAEGSVVRPELRTAPGGANPLHNL